MARASLCRSDATLYSARTLPAHDAGLDANEIQSTDVQSAFVSGHGWNVWGGSAPDKLCLLIADVAPSTGAANCIDSEQFATGGISRELKGRVASWYGGVVLQSIP